MRPSTFWKWPLPYIQIASTGRALSKAACSLSSPTIKMALISWLKFMIWSGKKIQPIDLPPKSNTKTSSCSSPKTRKKSKPKKSSTTPKAASPSPSNTCERLLSATSLATRACSSRSKTSSWPNWLPRTKAKTPGSKPSSRAWNGQPPTQVPKPFSAKTRQYS